MQMFHADVACRCCMQMFHEDVPCRWLLTYPFQTAVSDGLASILRPWVFMEEGADAATDLGELCPDDEEGPTRGEEEDGTAKEDEEDDDDDDNDDEGETA
jgi:hypothetical protein